MDARALVMGWGATDGGVVSRRFLVRSGADPSEVDELRRAGALRLIRRGWYETAAATPAVVSAVRAGAVLTCVSALKYRPGVWIPPQQNRLHVRWSEHRPRPVFPHRCGAHRPLPTPVRAVDPLPVALICAANCLEPAMLVAVLDSTLRMPTPYTVEDLRGYFAGAPKRVLRLLDCLDPLAGSGTESITRFRLRNARIAVRSQVRIPGVGWVDLLVGDRLIIECDSNGYHNGAQRKADCRRDRISTVGNYRVLRVDYEDVLFDWGGVFADVLAIVRKGRHRGTTDF